MSFSIEYDNQPLNFLKKQDKHIIKRIMDKIEEVLTNNSVPHNVKTMAGENGVYRIRIGDYRALYRINRIESKIVIFKLDKRSKIDKN